MPDRVNSTCPCCGTRLVVDTETGDILSEERLTTAEKKDFDEAVSKVHARASEREKEFSDAFSRTQRQEDLLEKKFEEARKKAAKDRSKKPRSPFDLD